MFLFKFYEGRGYFFLFIMFVKLLIFSFLVFGVFISSDVVNVFIIGFIEIFFL